MSSIGCLNLQLQFSPECVAPHVFHVFDNINLPYDGIIGNDLFIQLRCRINYNASSLEIFNNVINISFNEPSYIIPARSETVVECSVKNPEIKQGIVLDQHISNTLLISNCVVQVKNNDRINVSILNTSEHPVSLKSNLCLTLVPLGTESFQIHGSINPCFERSNQVINQLRTSHLNSEERDALQNICAEYSDIFHLPDDTLTSTSAFQHEIKINSSTPINVKSYRFPEIHKAEVKSQVLKMLDQNIIQPSTSPWSSPIWIVPKKIDASGKKKWRIVIDYRKLNDVTIGESYPLPQINEILDQLGKSKYFSTLDLASGFHQIEINPHDVPKTAFSIPEGHFEFVRMPFGLKNAPATFQRLMNTVLAGLQGIHCFVYLDDIVIYSYDLQSHITKLTNIFDRLRQFTLKLQPDKCEFLRKEVTYLGHTINEEGLQPNPDKIKSVELFPVPKCQKDVKSFLGLVSYYRRFIQDFSKIAKPLTLLLKKDTAFDWTNQQQLAFEKLKNALMTGPILIYPDFTKPFVLTCDASNFAISAILSQGTIGKDRPIAYASRTLNKAECNYSVTEKECLAIIFGAKTFRPYLVGHQFTIVTDHKPLNWLFNCKDPGSRLIRWRLKLEEYDYTIQYKKGKLNRNADALSRFPVDDTIPLHPIQGSPESVFLPPCVELPETENINNDNAHEVDPLGQPGDCSTDTNSPNVQAPEISTETEWEPRTNTQEETDNINPNPNITETHLPEIIPAGVANETSNIDPLEAINNEDKYSNCLKDLKDKKFKSNVVIQEHSSSILNSKYKIIIVPTSIDLDKSNHFIHDILGNLSDQTEITSKERTLHSFIKFENNNKIYYFLFTKVYHFDKTTYEDLFVSLKCLRNDIVINHPDETNIALTDFKNPYDNFQIIKICNLILYLFNNAGITINIYKNLIVYPTPTEIIKILKENHNIPIAGHLGSVRMLKRIQERFYWKNMRTDVENYVRKCEQCQTNKALRKSNRAPMQITSTSTQPLERVAFDIVGPLPESGINKYKFILTLQDDLTKFSLAYPMASATAEETCECLVHFITIFGIPKFILTDQGTNFTAEIFKQTCNFLKIKQLWSTPYHPQTQGALERSHSTLKEYLKSFVDENQSNWSRYVFTAMLSYNTTTHCTTNFTPYELLYGHKPFIPSSIYENAPDVTYHDYVRILQQRLNYSREKAIQNMLRSKGISKTYYDHKAKPKQYKVGDYVYIKNHLRLRKALSPVWKGPYRVVKIHGNNTLSVLINRRYIRHHYDEVKLAETTES